MTTTNYLELARSCKEEGSRRKRAAQLEIADYRVSQLIGMIKTLWVWQSNNKIYVSKPIWKILKDFKNLLNVTLFFWPMNYSDMTLTNTTWRNKAFPPSQLNYITGHVYKDFYLHHGVEVKFLEFHLEANNAEIKPKENKNSVDDCWSPWWWQLMARGEERERQVPDSGERGASVGLTWD